MRNLAILVLRIHVPGWVRAWALRELLAATAAAFQVSPPALARLSADALLYQYARFTLQQAQSAIQQEHDLEATRARLYQRAYALGARQRRLLHVRTLADALALEQILYRMIGIAFQGDTQGAVVIRHCYFSQFYSGQVCQLMSAMDSGLFAGLSGGWQLSFSARITAGQPCCRAQFTPGRSG